MLSKAGSLVALLMVAAVVAAGCSTGSNPTTSAGAAGSACASGVPETKVDLIGQPTTDPFWGAIKNGADQAAKDFCVKFTYVLGAQPNFPSTIQATQAAIASHPDGMAIVYFDKTFQASTSAALDAGIKVVLYNNNRFEQENAPTDPRILSLAYVGQNENFSGVRLANSWVSLVKPGTTVLLINPFPVAYVLTLRRNGVAQVLDAHGIKHEDLNMDSSGDEGKYLSIIGPYLQTHKEIGAVVGMGNPGANPAAKYVTDNNLSYPIATFDVGAEAANYIKAGTISMSINQQPYLQGYYAVEQLALQTKFGLRPANVDTGTFLVDKSNIAEVQHLISIGKG